MRPSEGMEPPPQERLNWADNLRLYVVGGIGLLLLIALLVIWVIEVISKWELGFFAILEATFGVILLGGASLLALMIVYAILSIPSFFFGTQRHHSAQLATHNQRKHKTFMETVAQMVEAPQWNSFPLAHVSQHFFVIGRACGVVDFNRDRVYYFDAAHIIDFAFDRKHFDSTTTGSTQAYTVGTSLGNFYGGVSRGTVNAHTQHRYIYTIDIHLTYQENPLVQINFGEEENLARQAFAHIQASVHAAQQEE